MSGDSVVWLDALIEEEVDRPFRRLLDRQLDEASVSDDS